MAFSAPVLRNLLSDLENSWYKKELSATQSENEVFITGLPRSGTTLLLELLYQTGEFSTFSYRHMPFILSPLLWKKLSSPFLKTAISTERAHGDGMQVNFDSPEAFEEIIWLNYHRTDFTSHDRITPLTPKNTTRKFSIDFQRSINKLLLDASAKQKNTRYISKNNANCSRITLLTKMFPSATLLIPFREPLSHIGSLMKQHRRFTRMHQQDPFSKRYMRWLGHFDFGENLKPINFNDWLDDLNVSPSYEDENFWLQYWIEAYSHILKTQKRLSQASSVFLIDFDKLIASPRESLDAIATKASLNNYHSLTDMQTAIRATTSTPKGNSSVDQDKLIIAQELHQQLVSAAL